jgi:adenosine deaminase
MNRRSGLNGYGSMLKVDLHRHLEGSLRLDTVLELARSQGLGLPSTDRLRGLVQITDDEPYTFENFLSKFQTLRLFYRSPEIIGRIAREAIEDAALDNIRYLELRFTPVALSRAEGFSYSEVMDWVVEGVRRAREEYNILVSLIVSVNRHESPQLAEQIIGMAVDRRMAGIVGVDLAGNEAHFSALPFASIFRDARKEGLHVSIHAGEWGGPNNVAEAIRDLKAERIGHGIRVLDDPGVVELAKEYDVTFEVCITSNFQSGAVPVLGKHPLMQMLKAGLNVTLNTDDPSISRIRLSDEYRLAVEDLGLSKEMLREVIFLGAKKSFLPDLRKQRLLQDLKKELIIN